MKILVNATSNFGFNKIIEANSLDEAVERLRTDKELVESVIDIPYRTSLRDKCVLQYGEYFGELYDKSCRGESIGNITQTKLFLEAIEKVRGYE